MNNETLIQTADRLLSYFFFETPNPFLESPEDYCAENERAIVLHRKVRKALQTMQQSSSVHCALLALSYQQRRYATPLFVTFGIDCAPLVAPLGYDLQEITKMISKGENQKLSGIRTAIKRKLAAAQIIFITIYLSQNAEKDFL